MKLLVELLEPTDNEAIVLMPITRVLCEELTCIGNLKLFPPGYFPFQLGDSQYIQRSSLMKLQSALTGFSPELFKNLTGVGFCAQLSRESIEKNSHDADITLLSQLSGSAEKSLDYLRLNYCQLDLPDTLPGPVGCWDMSNSYMGALIYFPSDDSWCDLAGAATSYSLVVAGIGLDLNACYVPEPPSGIDGEVGAIAAHALSLLSDAMHARNDTAKFMRCMTLLEFLGSPDEYKQWKRIKGEIACHLARDKAGYHACLEELRDFTSQESSSGDQVGYRTLVVHHGKFVEDIIPDREDRRALFRRLQSYSQAVINDMINNADKSWEEFLEYRQEKKASIGVG